MMFSKRLLLFCGCVFVLLTCPPAAAEPAKVGLYIASPFIPSSFSADPLLPGKLVDAAYLGATEGKNKRFEEVLSVRQIEKMGHIWSNISQPSLSNFFSRNIGIEIGAAEKKFGNQFKTFRVLMLSLHGSKEGEFSVEIEEYETKALAKASRKKRVGGCGMSSREVIERVRHAVASLASEEQNTPPQTLLRGGLTRVVKVGEPVTLDACSSWDPEEDTLSWEWRQIEPEHSKIPLIASPFSGRQLVFDPPEAGRYVFEVQASSWGNGNNPSAGNKVRITVEASIPPVAPPDQIKIIDFVSRKTLEDNRCSGDERIEESQEIILSTQGASPATALASWRQLSGPALPDMGDRCTTKQAVNDLQCVVKAVEEGLYIFELSLETPLGLARSTTKILLARPPSVKLKRYDTAVFPWNRLRLNYLIQDAFDHEPHARWRVWSDNGSKNPETSAIIMQDEQGASVFSASEEGTYGVCLDVTAKRELENLHFASSSHDMVTFKVSRPAFNATALLDFWTSFGPTYLNTGKSFLTPSLSMRLSWGLAAGSENKQLQKFMTRLLLPLFRVNLDPDRPLNDRVFQGGGTTIGPGYRIFSRNRFDMELYLDLYLRFRDFDSWGIGPSAAISYHIGDSPWEFYANLMPSIHFNYLEGDSKDKCQFNKEPGGRPWCAFYLRTALGIGRGF